MLQISTLTVPSVRLWGGGSEHGTSSNTSSHSQDDLEYDTAIIIIIRLIALHRSRRVQAVLKIPKTQRMSDVTAAPKLVVAATLVGLSIQVPLKILAGVLESTGDSPGSGAVLGDFDEVVRGRPCGLFVGRIRHLDVEPSRQELTLSQHRLAGRSSGCGQYW